MGSVPIPVYIPPRATPHPASSNVTQFPSIDADGPEPVRKTATAYQQHLSYFIFWAMSEHLNAWFPRCEDTIYHPLQEKVSAKPVQI